MWPLTAIWPPANQLGVGQVECLGNRLHREWSLAPYEPVSIPFLGPAASACMSDPMAEQPRWLSARPSAFPPKRLSVQSAPAEPTERRLSPQRETSPAIPTAPATTMDVAYRATVIRKSRPI